MGKVKDTVEGVIDYVNHGPLARVRNHFPPIKSRQSLPSPPSHKKFRKHKFPILICKLFAATLKLQDCGFNIDSFQ